MSVYSQLVALYKQERDLFENLGTHVKALKELHPLIKDILEYHQAIFDRLKDLKLERATIEDEALLEELAPKIAELTQLSWIDTPQLIKSSTLSHAYDTWKEYMKHISGYQTINAQIISTKSDIDHLKMTQQKSINNLSEKEKGNLDRIESESQAIGAIIIRQLDDIHYNLVQGALAIKYVEVAEKLMTYLNKDKYRAAFKHDFDLSKLEQAVERRKLKVIEYRALLPDYVQHEISEDINIQGQTTSAVEKANTREKISQLNEYLKQLPQTRDDAIVELGRRFKTINVTLDDTALGRIYDQAALSKQQNQSTEVQMHSEQSIL